MKDIGRYRLIRSSENMDAMIGWNEPHLDRKRWFESTGGGFCNWRDAKYLMQDDYMDIENFNDAHPRFSVRESLYEITYDDQDESIVDVFFCLEQYEGEKHEMRKGKLEKITKEELMELERAVHEWHITGRLVKKYEA